MLLVRLESPLPNTNTNSDFVQQGPMTSCNIFPTPINNYTQLTWHTDTNQNPAAKLPISFSSTLQKTRHFQRTNLNPYLPKMLQSKKLTTKISSQTEFTMSRRLSTHNFGIFVFCNCSPNVQLADSKNIFICLIVFYT